MHDENESGRNESDETLMRAVARGRRERMEPLLRRYANPTLTLIRRMIGDRHRSEEVFQEVFLAVWTSRRKYRHPQPFRPWLFGIAVNKCRAELRKRPAEATVLDDCPEGTLAGDDPSPEQLAIDAERALVVGAALHRLPSAQKAVVVMRMYNGLSYGEIAEAVDRTEGTVRSNMFHALGTMRKYLEPRLK